MATKEEGPRSFARFIENLSYGDAHSELSEALQRLGRALLKHAETTNQDAKGQIVLKLKFAASPKGHVAVGYQVTSKEPEPQRGGSVYFLSKGGNLQVDDPRQQKLPMSLREVRITHDGEVLEAEYEPRETLSV